MYIHVYVRVNVYVTCTYESRCMCHLYAATGSSMPHHTTLHAKSLHIYMYIDIRIYISHLHACDKKLDAALHIPRYQQSTNVYI